MQSESNDLSVCCLSALVGLAIIYSAYDFRKAHRVTPSWTRRMTNMIVGPFVFCAWATALESEPMGCGGYPPEHPEKTFLYNLYMYPKQLFWRIHDKCYEFYIVVICEGLCMGFNSRG